MILKVELKLQNMNQVRRQTVNLRIKKEHNSVYQQSLN